ILLVRVDRTRMVRHRRAVRPSNVVEIAFGPVLLNRQRSRRAARKVVEREGVPRHRAGELVSHPSIGPLRRGIQRAQRLTARAGLDEQLRDGARREAAASVLGRRDDAPDPAHPELAPAPPLPEVARAGRRDEAAVLDEAPHLLHRQPRRAFGERALTEVERDAHQPDELLPVLVARRDHVRRRHRTNAHPHGIAPHFGQPLAYRAAACSRSTPARLASEPSHASTSPNSCTRSPSPRSARATSPTSSVNHRNVPSTPRSVSRSTYVRRRTSWSAAISIRTPSLPSDELGLC